MMCCFMHLNFQSARYKTTLIYTIRLYNTVILTLLVFHCITFTANMATVLRAWVHEDRRGESKRLPFSGSLQQVYILLDKLYASYGRS